MEKNKSSTGKTGGKGVIGRNVKIGEEWTTVTVVLTRKEIDLINAAVGYGNRSSYLRWLVDSADGKEGMRFLQLEEENRVMYHMLQKEKKEQERLKQRLKVMKEGGDMQMQLINESLEDVTKKYGKWKEGIKKTRGKIPIKLKLSWIEGNAKGLRMKPQHLFSLLEPKNG
jgi:hypothetical protein